MLNRCRCHFCGCKFEAVSVKHRFCSDACRSHWHKRDKRLKSRIGLLINELSSVLEDGAELDHLTHDIWIEIYELQNLLEHAINTKSHTLPLQSTDEDEVF